MKKRIIESIEKKLKLKNGGLLESYSLFNTIRRMKIIERLFNGKELG